MTKDLRREVLEKAQAARRRHHEAGLYTPEEEARIAALELRVPGADLPPLRRLEEIAFRLSQGYSAAASTPSFSSHRPGLGRYIVAAKRLAHRLARPVLAVILANQINFNREVVEFSREVADSSARLEEKADSTLARVVRLVRRLEASAPSRAEHRSRADGRAERQATPGLPPLEYLALEDRHRGTPEEIGSRQAGYLEYFHDAPGPVLDLGCGRGEFLELLARSGIEAKGADLNPDMVLEARAKGLDVVEADGVGYLTGLEPASLGGLFMAQVLEHLEFPRLIALLEAAYEALAPGGTILAETINPQSLGTFASAFYVDPTHVRPIHPEAARFLFESTGFRQVSIVPVNPVPEQARLKPVGRFTPGSRVINENILRLNNLLFAPQDYAVIAKR